MRLDKFLEQAAVGSRKGVKRLLLTGAVCVNHAQVREGRYNVDGARDVITLKGEVLKPDKGHRYVMLNKPAGVVTAVRDKQHPTVLDLVRTKEGEAPLFPVGRLDRDTEGLLLLTNNGKLAYRLLQPSHHVVKGYEVVVNGLVTEADVVAFAAGIRFASGVQCLGAKLEIIEATPSSSYVSVEIVEGKFHQVKKMFLVVGKKVVSLKRVKMAGLTLDPGLALGASRELSSFELDGLHDYFNP